MLRGRQGGNVVLLRMVCLKTLKQCRAVVPSVKVLSSTSDNLIEVDLLETWQARDADKDAKLFAAPYNRERRQLRQ